MKREIEGSRILRASFKNLGCQKKVVSGLGIEARVHFFNF